VTLAAGLQRQVRVYTAIAGMAIKARLAYSLWVWSDFLSTIGTMLIYSYFWRAVYSQTESIGGLVIYQTITYILMARILAPMVETRMIFMFGFLVREGGVAMELTRPLDLQFRYLVETLAEMGAFLVQRIPVFLIAWLLMGMQLPTDPEIWGIFFISLILGQLIIFLFDWSFACLAFYTTETWGLSALRLSIGSFLSGALVPLAILPGWLQKVAEILPFSQTISVPISFLCGIYHPKDAVHIWLTQLAWLAGLLIFSRFIFSISVKKITVQGG